MSSASARQRPRQPEPQAPVVRRVLEETLAYARQRGYTGWDYADGMSSRILRALPFDNKWVNLAFQETIKRFPVNVRPLFLVEQRQSFKGSALFAMANLAAADLLGDPRYRSEARTLHEWLIDHQSAGYAGFCGGHQHALQDLLDKKDPGVPGIVSTAYAMLALLEGEAIDDHYPAVALTGADYVFDDLEYRETASGARIKYKPDDGEEAFVLNANAIAARILLELHDRFDRPTFRDRAELILDYVVSHQSASGGWKYMDPPSYSHLSMDNHHNGFIVESLLRHRQITDSDRYATALNRSYDFYRRVLFAPSGAPNWDETQAYPRDIHGAAQGIIVFSLGGDLAFARRILQWTLDNLYAGEGRFYYQRRRWYTKRITLMRWCEGWMAYAMTRYLQALPDGDVP